MAIELRPYQRAAVDAIYNYFTENDGHPLVVIPTAGGKSLIQGTFIKEAVEQYPGTRILALTHVKELIAQNYAELIGFWHDAPAGIYSAGLGKRQINAQILFAGIKSIHRHAYRLQRIDLVLVDEAHLIPRNSNTIYRKFLDELRQINPLIKIVGFTATPFRVDSGRLHEGEDAMFTDIAYEVGIRELIDAGYLCPPVTASNVTQINTTGVGTRAGEFIAGQLEAAALDPDTVEAIADEIVSLGADRRGWLVFGCGVDHCAMLRDALRERGINAEAILGTTSHTERDWFIAAFKRQKIRALVSMGVLTTGFNAKHVDMVAVARPTKSTGLWVQIVGRGTRTYPGKVNCLVADFGGNVARHGPIDNPLIKDKAKKGPGDEPTEAPTKACPNDQCDERSPISARECAACGCPFPEASTKISTQASALDILSNRNLAPEWLDVTGVVYKKWEKAFKPTSVMAEYQCGLMRYRTWLLPEHDGGARNRFVKWWREATGQNNPPANAQGVIDMKALIRTPVQIAVRPAGKYFDVCGYRYAGEGELAA